MGGLPWCSVTPSAHEAREAPRGLHCHIEPWRASVLRGPPLHRVEASVLGGSGGTLVLGKGAVDLSPGGPLLHRVLGASVLGVLPL